MCVPGRYRVTRSLSTRTWLVAIGEGSLDDAFDDLALGVGVVLDEGPLARGQLALGPLITDALVVVGAQAVAKRQHAVDLPAAVAECVEVDVRVRPLEQAVLEPVRFADAQDVARR